jgi:hypothetical protein
MARPNKKGLEYFPFDVDFFNDEKIGAISGEFGIKGEMVCIRLLCAIYRNGYFAVWNEALKMKLIKELSAVTANLLDEIVSRAVRWGFFNKDLFENGGILTSNGIQRRYFEIIKRRKGDDEILPYILIDRKNKEINVYNNPVNVDNNPVIVVNVDNNPVNVDINAQSKVNKSKVNKNTPLTPLSGGRGRFDFSFVEDDFKKPFDDWIEYKEKRRETYKTQASLEACYRKLKNLSGNNPVTAGEVIEQSLANNWAGLFELIKSKGNKLSTLQQNLKNKYLDGTKTGN